MERKNDRKSLLMLIASMMIFGSLGLVKRGIPQSSAFLAFARGSLGALFIAAFVKLRGGRIRHGLNRRDFTVLAVAGAVMGVNWLLLFEAMNYTSVATATLCYYMEPTIIMLLSPLLFKEKFGLKKLICAAAALLGMVLISGITEGAQPGSDNIKGVLLGLSAAVCYSVVVILNKNVHNADAYEKSIIQLTSAAAIMVPYILYSGGIGSNDFSLRTTVLILVAGLLYTGVTYVLYFGCMDGLRAQTIAVLSYIDPVVALFVSALLLREPLSFAGAVGAVLIIGAAVVSETDFKRAAVKAPDER